MLQFGLVSIVDDLGPVPVACHLFDGNRNGHTGIKEQYHVMRNFLHLPEDFLLVSDRGTCSAEHLARLRRNQHYALCAGQWQDYSPLFDQHADRLLWNKASYLSREQQRRRATASSLPLEEYRLAVVAHQLVDPTTKKPFNCRVIFVHSSAAEKECQERREKNIAIIKAGLDKVAQKLERAHPTTTPESVARQIARLLGMKAAAKHFHWQLVPLTEAERAVLPPPKKGFRRQTHRLEYSLDEASAKAESRHDGVSALISTAPLTYSGDALFTEYKRQTYVEREHHELKTPLAVTPIFLKTPQRVESLVSLLFVALQTYMTIERLYRQSVACDAGVLEQRMTAERILRKFRVCCVAVQERAYGELITAAQLSTEQRRILQQLSLPTPAKLLTKIHDPPPTS
jgi:transposase